MTASSRLTDDVPAGPRAARGRTLNTAAFVLLVACAAARCFLAELPFEGSALQFVPDRPAARPVRADPAGDNPIAYQADRSQLSRMTFAVLLLAAGALWALGGAAAGRLTVRHGHVAVLILLFAVLSLISALGASNRRAALSTWIEQLSLLGAGFLAIQLCADRKRFAMLLAVLAGLGVALAAKGLWQLAVEVPRRAADFQAHRLERLAGFGWDPNTPQAALIEARVLSPAVTGFFALANPFGSLLIVLAFAAAGLAVDKLHAVVVSRRVRQGRRKKGEVDLPTLAAGLATLAAVPVAAALILTRSRGAILSAVPAGLGLTAVLVWGRRLARHWRKCLIGLAAAAALGGGGVLAYGLKYDSLPGKTMTFRWHYWTASAGIIRGRSLLGVGPGNFSTAYLQSRRDEAEEDIQMPHNVVAHALAQYGVPGGLCYLGVLGCLLVGCARPRDPEPPVAADASVNWRGAWMILAAVVLATLGARILYGQAIGGAAPAVLSSAVPIAVLAAALAWTSWSGGGRWGIPPWSAGAARAALGCGAAAFVLHNMVTYSLWMPAPASVFYLAAGACAARSGGARARTLRLGAWAVAGGGAAAVAAAVVLLWLPVRRRTYHTAGMLSGLEHDLTHVAVEEARLAAAADPLDAQAAADAAQVAMIRMRISKARGGALAREAVELAEQAIRRDRDNHAHHRMAGNIAWTLAMWASPKFALAVATGNEGFLAGRTNEAEVFWSRAEMAPAAFGPAADAVEHLARAVELNPRDSRLRIDFAGVLCDTQRLRECLRQLDEAVRLDATLPGESVAKLAPPEHGRIEMLRARARLLLSLRDEKGRAESQPATAKAAGAPSLARPAPAAEARWPGIREGHYVNWVGRVWNTRKRAKISQAGGVGTLGQRNGTGTYLGEERVNGGIVELDVKFDAGYLAPQGGGKHFLEIMSWMADRGDREAIRAKPSSRIELANLGDRPRCIVWNYGPHFQGRATRIFPIGPAFKPDRWYRVRFDWSYRQPGGQVTIHVDDRSYSEKFELVKGTIGPGRFFLFGHVETTQPQGRLHFRNFKVSGRK